VGVPVLVVANASQGWDLTAAHAGPATSFLPLPISLPGLTGELERLLAGGPVAVAPPANESELLSAVAASVGLTVSDAGHLARDDDPRPSAAANAAALDTAVVDPAPEPPEATEATERVIEVPPVLPPLPQPPKPPVPPVPPTEPPPPVPAAPPAVAAPPVAPPVPARTALTTLSAPPLGADVLVDALTEHAGELLGVAECAEVVVAEFAERVGADAAVLLLPDGHEWRVAGGLNLRPLEHRARLDAEHWLVHSVALDGQGLVVDDTDGARDQLHGAPLASWPRLVAVPVPGVGGLFLAARHGAAFQESVLSAAVDVANEAAPLLRDALAVRTLARALAPLADLDDD
jgi:hypothetical protein